MKDKNYRVFRDDIYVGRVIVSEKVRPIHEFGDNGTKENQIKKDSYLIAPMYYPYRTIFFTLDEDKKANDLLYNSPAYPVLNITDNSYFEEHKNETVVLIDDVIYMGEILKYFNYGLVLNYQDILGIKEMFFSGDFAQNHCEVFGYRKVDSTAKTPQFAFDGREKLPRRYFSTIPKLENHKLKEVLKGEYTKMNSFRPCISENKVRRLKKK